eukprot:9495937-Pyramimonas_sp.AAC.1
MSSRRTPSWPRKPRRSASACASSERRAHCTAGRRRSPPRIAAARLSRWTAGRSWRAAVWRPR